MRAPVLLLGVVACGPASDDTGPVDPCVAARASEAPQTLEAMVEHLNTLPMPVDAACIVRSLPRPLPTEAIDGLFSAQPSDGVDSPRLFFFLDDLTVSLVPTGPGSQVIEFGQHTDALNTRKGELPLPITAPLDPLAPVHHIEDDRYGTTCAVCHVDQVAHPDGGFTSVAIGPDDDTAVDLWSLQATLDVCGPAGGPPRCALLEAVFEEEVVHEPFDEDYPTLGEL